jgi:hypothetical protein
MLVTRKDVGWYEFVQRVGTFFAALSYYQLSMPVVPLPRVPAHDTANAFKIYDRAMFNASRVESKGGFACDKRSRCHCCRAFRIAIVRIGSIRRAIQFLRCRQGRSARAFD